MVLSVDLFKACCASVAKITTYASLDPMLGIPTGNPAEYLKQHNFSVDDALLYYQEALQKGTYMLETAFRESETWEENIFVPLVGENYEDKKKLKERIISICQKFRSAEVMDELLAEFNETNILKALQEIGYAKDIFTPPDTFVFYLNKITGHDASDLAFTLLVNKGMLFHAIDFQFRALFINDNRMKNLGGLSSFTKMKLRTNLISKQIASKEKQKLQQKTAGNQEEAEKLEKEILVYQQGLNKMNEFLATYDAVLDNLSKTISDLEQQAGHEVLRKVNEMPLLPSKTKEESQGGGSGEIVEEIVRLTKQSMEFLGQDRIEFSHNLLGAVLESQQPKIEKAKSLFEKIPNTSSQKPILANRLGVIFNASGQPDKAAEFFRRALVLLPNSKRQERAPVESNLFHALLNRGSFDAALKYMIESLETGSEECSLFDVERFLPKKILGVGGMGVTFLCEDVYEERQVVVKTLWRYDVGGSLKETFSEAFTAKKIGDPHIIKIYDIGRHRANRPFIVMEYCEGIDLQKYIQELRQGEPLNLPEALQIILEVASGLGAAHTQAPPIVHRDIKPNNILYNANTKEVKIIDFGIACMLPAPDEISRSITRSSSGSIIAKSIAGTWGYMSPEQQRGEKNLTPQTDVFALGKTLMFLLTGKTPPPENIFALKPEVRDYVGELAGYCLMPKPEERYTVAQIMAKVKDIQTTVAKKASKATNPVTAIGTKAETEVEEVEVLNLSDQVEEQPMESAPAVLDDSQMQAIEASSDDSEGMNELEAPMMQADPVSEDTLSTDISHKSEAEPASALSIPGEPEAEPISDMPENIGGDGSSALFDSASFSAEESPSQPQADVDVQDVVVIGESLEGTGGTDDNVAVAVAIDENVAEVPITVEENAAVAVDVSASESEAAVEQAGTQEEQQSMNVSYDLDDFSAPPESQPSDSPELSTEANGGTANASSFSKVNLPNGYSWEGDIVICEKDGATMIYIPAGSFCMGHEGEGSLFAEGPEHDITLDSYLIDECPVTWYQYTLFCDETGRQKPVKPCWEIDESQPVVNITWEDANAYAEWAGKTLCTEAQWEKAAKGGYYFDGEASQSQKNPLPKRRYPWGDEAPNSKDDWLANCSGERQYGDRSPSPVGSYPAGASPYGCLDMSGNVWEWCQDWFNDTYYKTCPNANPKGPKTGSGKIVRGGAWNNSFEHITTTYRSWMEPNQWWDIIGFRTAKPLIK